MLSEYVGIKLSWDIIKYARFILALLPVVANTCVHSSSFRPSRISASISATFTLVLLPINNTNTRANEVIARGTPVRDPLASERHPNGYGILLPGNVV